MRSIAMLSVRVVGSVPSQLMTAALLGDGVGPRGAGLASAAAAPPSGPGGQGQGRGPPAADAAASVLGTGAAAPSSGRVMQAGRDEPGDPYSATPTYPPKPADSTNEGSGAEGGPTTADAGQQQQQGAGGMFSTEGAPAGSGDTGEGRGGDTAAANRGSGGSGADPAFIPATVPYAGRPGDEGGSSATAAGAAVGRGGSGLDGADEEGEAFVKAPAYGAEAYAPDGTTGEGSGGDTAAAERDGSGSSGADQIFPHFGGHRVVAVAPGEDGTEGASISAAADAYARAPRFHGSPGAAPDIPALDPSAPPERPTRVGHSGELESQQHGSTARTGDGDSSGACGGAAEDSRRLVSPGELPGGRRGGPDDQRVMNEGAANRAEVRHDPGAQSSG